MPFIDLSSLELKDFRPGVKSWAHLGEHLIMAVMTIEEEKVDSGHTHPYEQAGVVLEGIFTLTLNGETKPLGPGQGYFIPAGIHHAWSITRGPVRILDVSAKM
jgi:quercetin dioxygenase-like cupin family protein